MKIYYINLTAEKRRRRFMEAQLKCLRAGFERITAVEGRKLKKSEYLDFVSQRRGKKTPWLSGQVGCFLSHWAAWEKIAAGRGKFGCVLEDDVFLAEDFSRLMAEIVWISAGADVVRLEAPTNRVLLKGLEELPFEGRKMARVASASWCAGGYILSREVARKLLKMPLQTHDAVDAFLFGGRLGLAVYQVVPAVVVQDKHRFTGEREGFGSAIEEAARPRRRGFKQVWLGALKWVAGYRLVRFAA